MSAPLVFVIPVRHHASVADWAGIKGYIAQTLTSVSAQTVPDWECILVANEGADLPELPDKCRARYVDLPLPDLPSRTHQREAYYEAVRADKGLRIYHGLDGVAGDSHVMVVDFDDFVSRDLAKLVIDNRAAPGWNIEKGYVWSGGNWCYLHPQFHEVCGTSHVIRRDLYGVLDRSGQPDMIAIKRRLGSHIFIHHDLAAEGQPLEPLPFPGAVYRIGNSQSTSGTGMLFKAMTPLREIRRHPLTVGPRLLHYRRMGEKIRQEFSLPAFSMH